ncbi:MAG: hypothetical protein PHT28_04225, partial [Dehalococcoidales bacterium]|nr:hypothetical protein [Dehalococcoidales bacterium]
GYPLCHSGRLPNTNVIQSAPFVIQSASEESHTGCARSYGNTPMLRRALLRGRSFGSKPPLDDIVKEKGKILRRAFALLWMILLMDCPPFRKQYV